MNRYLFIVVASFLFIQLNAQNEESFNFIYNKTYLETSQKDFPKAIRIADSLYRVSETPILQTKSLMLSATLYQHSGDIQSAIDYALRAEDIIIKSDNYFWISRVYGFLATQYRITGLYNHSKKYADLAFENTEKIEEGETKYSTQAMLLQEMAFREITQKKHIQALKYLELSQNYFEKVKIDKDYFLAQNEQLMGACYLKLNKKELSLKHYERALELYGDLPDNYVKGLIFDGLARNYLKREEFETAKSYLDSAKTIAESSNYLELKNEIYNTSQEYFMLIKDMESLTAARKKQDAISEEIIKNKTTFIDNSFNEVKEENTFYKQDVSFKNKILLISILLFFCGISYFFYYRQTQKKNILKIKQIISELEKKQSEPIKSVSLKSSILNEFSDNELKDSERLGIMTSGTEEKLLAKLEKFEASGLFTQNSISLSSLATYCETNTKYLSHIINTYKKQDFNNYINELRINYIIKKLNENPLYRKYKIATLADESGFSSQNKFATVFKKVTSISPSSFIKYLEQESVENVV